MAFVTPPTRWLRHQTREKKLEILKDSHTGAFAVIGLLRLPAFDLCAVDPAGGGAAVAGGGDRGGGGGAFPGN